MQKVYTQSSCELGIDPEGKVNIVSNRADFTIWYGMPSVLYSAPLNTRTDTIVNRILDTHKVFGRCVNFKSMQGFSEDFTKLMQEDKYSHAELLDKFENQKCFEKHKNHPNSSWNFHHSLAEIKEQGILFEAQQNSLKLKNQSALQLLEDGSIKHNEIMMRHHLWDACAIEMGHSKNEGLCALTNLLIARKVLLKELEHQKMNHPLFIYFLKEKLSIDGGSSLNQRDSEKLYTALEEQDKQAVLDEIKTRLCKPVSLFHYIPAQSLITRVEMDNISSKDVVDSINTVLTQHLGASFLNNLF